MSLIKKLAGETVIYGVSSILGRLINYVVMAFYLTRVFANGEYGVISDMYAYVALLMVFLTYRMETTFFRFASRGGDMEKTFSTTSISLFFSTTIFVALLFFFTPSIATWLEYPNHPEYIYWFIFIMAFDTLAAIPFARLRLENRPIRFASIKILNILVNVFFIFFFLAICPFFIKKGWTFFESFYNPNNRIVYVFIANFLGSLAVLLFLLPEYRKLQFQFDKALWKKMILYAMPLIIVGVAGVINQSISTPLLKNYLPNSTFENLDQAGTYSACFKLAMLMSLFIQAFNYAAEPFFFKNANRKDSQDVYAQVGQVFSLVASLVFLGITLYIDVIKYMIPDTYWGAIAAVPILLIAFFFLGLYYNFSIWYKLTDKTIYGAYISVGGAIITIVLSVLLIPKIGYFGSAWAAFACFGFMAIASYVVGRKYYPIPYPIGRMLGYIILAVLVFLLASSLRPLLVDLWLVLGVNTLLMFAYLGIIWFFEKELLKEIVKG